VPASGTPHHHLPKSPQKRSHRPGFSAGSADSAGNQRRKPCPGAPASRPRPDRVDQRQPLVDGQAELRIASSGLAAMPFILPWRAAAIGNRRRLDSVRRQVHRKPPGGGQVWRGSRRPWLRLATCGYVWLRSAAQTRSPCTGGSGVLARVAGGAPRPCGSGRQVGQVTPERTADVATNVASCAKRTFTHGARRSVIPPDPSGPQNPC
jgi:hypothetical protein